MRKKVLILAKSNKKRHDGVYGKCIAGVSLEPEDRYEWIRLVADKEGDSLLDSQFPYETLDVIDVELFPCPLGNQIENCCFQVYGKVGHKNLDELRSIFDNMPHSFFGSMNDFVISPRNSLTILFAKNLHIHWLERAGNRYQKVDFDMGNNHAVNISMTDPEHYTNKAQEATKDIPLAICVASLPSEPIFQNHYTKFIAAIFPIEDNQNFKINDSNFEKSPFIYQNIPNIKDDNPLDDADLYEVPF